MLQPQTPLFTDSSRLGTARFLEVADSIGRQLVRDAVWSGDRCSWMVWTKEPVAGAFRSVYRSAALDLYQGVSGIALFLAYLSGITQDRAQRETVDGALRQIAWQLRHVRPEQFGFYSGGIGAAYALCSIGARFASEQWIQTGLDEVDRVSGQASVGNQLDLLSGSAGAILALLKLAQRFDRPRLLDRTETFAAAIETAAVRSDTGTSWPMHAGETRHLTGLSHGTSGMALALLELNHRRPNPAWLALALSALQYERNLFDPRQRNWPDFRTFPGVPQNGPTYPVAWCHGSTGIGLSRLRIRELLPADPALLPEIDAALSGAILALNGSGAGADFTLCHGATGNGELLLSIGQSFGHADAVAASHKVGDLGISLFQTPSIPWACGVPDAGETPALMTGIAGIGLYYLRLFDPSAAPSVLMPWDIAGPAPAYDTSANSVPSRESTP